MGKIFWKESLEKWVGIYEAETGEGTSWADGTARAKAWSCRSELSIWRMTGDSLVLGVNGRL